MICHNVSYPMLSRRARRVMRQIGRLLEQLWPMPLARLAVGMPSSAVAAFGGVEAARSAHRHQAEAEAELQGRTPPPTFASDRGEAGGGGKTEDRAPGCVSEFPGLGVFGLSVAPVTSEVDHRVREGAGAAGETEGGRVDGCGALAPSPLEGAIWSVIKGWDIRRCPISGTYSGATGDDVRAIAGAVRRCFGAAPRLPSNQWPIETGDLT